MSQARRLPPEPLPSRPCPMCGFPFTPAVPGEKMYALCPGCFRRTRDEESYDRGYMDGAHDAWQEGYTVAQDRIRRRLAPAQAILDILPELIALAHPDRHPDRGEQANRVTAILLDAGRRASP